MSRLITARISENNKNATLRYSNRLSNIPKSTPYGEQYEYGDIEELDVCLVPISTSYEADAYGVNLVGSFKVSLTMEQAKLFNEFTHIWVKGLPNDKCETEFVVKSVPTVINYGLMVISKKVGE